MNLTEKNTVIDFLKSKKLSYPLYKEVLDHFFLDIDQKMLEGMGFQEAFIHVKLKWHDEFKMVSPDILSIGRIPRIEARIRQSYYKAIFKNSFVIAGVFLLFQLLYPQFQSYIIVGLSFCFVFFTFTHFKEYRFSASLPFVFPSTGDKRPCFSFWGISVWRIFLRIFF